MQKAPKSLLLSSQLFKDVVKAQTHHLFMDAFKALLQLIASSDCKEHSWRLVGLRSICSQCTALGVHAQQHCVAAGLDAPGC